jgi:hypothetical protein
MIRKFRVFTILRLHLPLGDATVCRVVQALCCASILVNVQYERAMMYQRWSVCVYE